MRFDSFRVNILNLLRQDNAVLLFSIDSATNCHGISQSKEIFATYIKSKTDEKYFTVSIIRQKMRQDGWMQELTNKIFVVYSSGAVGKRSNSASRQGAVNGYKEPGQKPPPI